VRKAFWVDFTFKYKAIAAPINISTKIKNAKIAAAI